MSRATHSPHCGTSGHAAQRSCSCFRRSNRGRARSFAVYSVSINSAVAMLPQRITRMSLQPIKELFHSWLLTRTQHGCGTCQKVAPWGKSFYVRKGQRMHRHYGEDIASEAPSKSKRPNLVCRQSRHSCGERNSMLNMLHLNKAL